MERVLIIPAAGRGSRLASHLPKALYPVSGRPMIDHLLDLYGPFVDEFVLVVSPECEPMVRRHCSGRERISFAVQPRPDGMLPAILTATTAIAARPGRSIWITWCDQIAIRPSTVRRLIELTTCEPAPDLVFPTVWKRDPYIHFERDSEGTITAVRHRREGDEMPEVGEGDSGLFALSAAAYFESLPAFAREPHHGAATGERNFLPFIPWIAGRGNVATFAVEHEVESMGVNTESDARYVESQLAALA